MQICMRLLGRREAHRLHRQRLRRVSASVRPACDRARLAAAAREAEVAVTTTWKTKATAATTGSYKKSLTPSGAPPPRRSLADLP